LPEPWWEDRQEQDNLWKFATPVVDEKLRACMKMRSDIDRMSSEREQQQKEGKFYKSLSTLQDMRAKFRDLQKYEQEFETWWREFKKTARVMQRKDVGSWADLHEEEMEAEESQDEEQAEQAEAEQEEERRRRQEEERLKALKPWAEEEEEEKERKREREEKKEETRRGKHQKATPLYDVDLEESDMETHDASAGGSSGAAGTVAPSSSATGTDIAMQKTMQWMEEHMTQMANEDKKRIADYFIMANFQPWHYVHRVDIVQMRSKGTYWRLNLIKRGVQQGLEDPSNQSWSYQGFHCSTEGGAIKILRARRLEAMTFNGVYALMVQQPKEFADVKTVAMKVAKGKRDLAGVLFEIGAHCQSTLLKSGGTEADEKVCATGKIAHMKTTNEDRWLIPEDRITLKAVWLTSSSMQDLYEQGPDADIPM
jgi:hypothetical protein